MLYLGRLIDNKGIMKGNIQNILLEKIKILNLSKNEFFYKILKSISQNNNISINKKLYSRYLLVKSIKKKKFFSRKHKICILTGKRSGVVSGFNFSRYNIKNLILKNRLTNFKKNNW